MAQTTASGGDFFTVRCSLLIETCLVLGSASSMVLSPLSLSLRATSVGHLGNTDNS